MPPTRGRSGSLQVINKRQSTVYEKIRNTQKFDASVDRNLANGGDYTSIFIKVIGHELSHSSRADLYSRCWMDFLGNTVGTEAPHFVNLGIPSVNASDVVNIFSTPTTRIRRRSDGPHWFVLDRDFGEAIAVRMNAKRSELDYSYKTGFQNERKNQDFGRQNITMSQPPLG